MLKCDLVLYWSDEDQAFVAEAPELPGCMAHGEDQESAIRNIREAMQVWIERARKLGRSVPEPKGVRLMLASPEDRWYLGRAVPTTTVGPRLEFRVRAHA